MCVGVWSSTSLRCRTAECSFVPDSSLSLHPPKPGKKVFLSRVAEASNANAQQPPAANITTTAWKALSTGVRKRRVPPAKHSEREAESKTAEREKEFHLSRKVDKASIVDC